MPKGISSCPELEQSPCSSSSKRAKFLGKCVMGEFYQLLDREQGKKGKKQLNEGL